MSLIPRKRMSSDLLDPKPKKGSFNGVTSDGVYEAIGEATDNILDDGSTSESIVVAVPSSQSSNYIVGNYYRVLGKIARLRTKTEGDNVTQLTFDTTSGVIDAVNGVIEDISSIGSPLQWKGPATVAQLNAGITGIQPGWTYTLTDAGTLTDGSVDVEVGDEVAWTGTAWFKVGGDSSKIAVFEVSPAQGKPYPTFNQIYSEVTAGKTVALRVVSYNGSSDSPADYYYLHNYQSAPNFHLYTFSNGKKTKSVTSLDVWSEADIVYGLAYGGSKTEADLVEGALAIASTNSLTRLTLTTAQTLTVVANADIPNFAIEIDNTGNSNDVTVTVKDFGGTTTLKPSAAGGNTVGAGKYVQLTCVGSCWTLAEFTATP